MNAGVKLTGSAGLPLIAMIANTSLCEDGYLLVSRDECLLAALKLGDFLNALTFWESPFLECGDGLPAVAPQERRRESPLSASTECVNNSIAFDLGYVSCPRHAPLESKAVTSSPHSIFVKFRPL